MDMQILVVSSDPLDRQRLEDWHSLHSRLGDTLDFTYVATVADAMREPRCVVPDLILLNPLRQNCRGDDVLTEALGTVFRAAPIVILAEEAALPARRDRHPGQPVAHIVLALATWQLLRELFTCIVIAARHAHVLSSETGGGAVLEAIADAVISTDANGKVRYLNTAALRLTLHTSEEALGMPIAELMVLRDVATFVPMEHPALETVRTGRAVRLPKGCVLLRNDGSEIVIEDSTSPITSDSGAICGSVMVFHDITDAHELQAQVDYLAWHDFLTGLPNRFAAQRQLNRMLADAEGHGESLAVMYLDLDKFKSVNDTLGHAAGDTLLVLVASRLRGCFRVIDLVSRQGGDEFVVLMAPGAGRADAMHAAQRILAAIGQPHDLEDAQVHVGCSIGIALYPEHGRTGETLLRHADTALHAAKAAGRNSWKFFTQDLLTSAVQRTQLEDGLRHGLASNEFELFYQPKISLADGQLCGCEALLRWRHPEWGWVSPARFIRSAEESGLIVQLGRWVLIEAIRQAKAWEAGGHCPGPVAINVSALELRHAGFADGIEQHIAAARLAPASLQLELTESTLMRDMRKSIDILQRLKRLGLSLAIDDFGTGYSSLGYLAELPIDLLKVDRTFVHGISHADPRKQTLLRAVLALADSMALPTVAEGIETAQEASFLVQAGCLQGQGYYYSRALDAEAFESTYLGSPGRIASHRPTGR